MPRAVRRGILAVLLLSAALGCTAARGAVPAQFIARLYTDALGRAPDPGAWQNAVASFEQTPCTRTSLQSWTEGVLASAEFRGLAYDPAAYLLVLYRAILAREPDAPGFAQHLAELAPPQGSLDRVITTLLESPEFERLSPLICSGGSYSFAPLGGGLAIEIRSDAAHSKLSEADLQGLLNAAPAGQTVYLTQESVVYLTGPLVIPPGVTLATQGLPGPRQHGRMARLVRAAPFAGPMVQINPQGDLTATGGLNSIWVDGQRQLGAPFVPGAINIEIYGGSDIRVESSFIANTLGWSSLHTYGALDGRPCAGNTITGNLITVYPSMHANQEWADGLSIGCENSLVENNQIIDPTDAGIVVFTAYPATQRTLVTTNTVISAGNSAFGAMGFDPLQGRSAGAPDFTGASISDNSFWSGPNTHIIIGLAVGSRPWYGQGSIGYGAKATGNTTAGIQTRMGAGIVVSGMQNAAVQGNVFTEIQIPPSWTSCPTGAVLASVSAGLASGSIQPYADVPVSGCMSDYSASGSAAADQQQTKSASSADPPRGGGGALDSDLIAMLVALVCNVMRIRFAQVSDHPGRIAEQRSVRAHHCLRK